VVKGLIAQIRQTEAALLVAATGEYSAELLALQWRLADGAQALEQVVEYVLDNIKSDIKGVFAGSVLYLKLAGIVLGGWQMARAALVASDKLKAGEGDVQFYRAKIATAQFYADHILTQAASLQVAIVEGSAGVLALDVEQF